MTARYSYHCSAPSPRLYFFLRYPYYRPLFSQYQISITLTITIVVTIAATIAVPHSRAAVPLTALPAEEQIADHKDEHVLPLFPRSAGSGRNCCRGDHWAAVRLFFLSNRGLSLFLCAACVKTLLLPERFMNFDKIAQVCGVALDAG